MRIPSIFALCLASAVSLSASGQSTQTAAPAQSAPSNNSSAQPAAQKAATTKASAQPASQPDPQDAQVQKPRTQRTWPQMSFDKGIYIGRNGQTGDRYCLAIQSYNFSQGQSPQLESVTTCTELRQPLWRNAGKPESRDQQSQGNQQHQGNQQIQEKDQK
jgi:hypothetical protein